MWLSRRVAAERRFSQTEEMHEPPAIDEPVTVVVDLEASFDPEDPGAGGSDGGSPGGSASPSNSSPNESGASSDERESTADGVDVEALETQPRSPAKSDASDASEVCCCLCSHRLVRGAAETEAGQGEASSTAPSPTSAALAAVTAVHEGAESPRPGYQWACCGNSSCQACAVEVRWRDAETPSLLRPPARHCPTRLTDSL